MISVRYAVTNTTTLTTNQRAALIARPTSNESNICAKALDVDANTISHPRRRAFPEQSPWTAAASARGPDVAHAH